MIILKMLIKDAKDSNMKGCITKKKLKMRSYSLLKVLHTYTGLAYALDNTHLTIVL